MPKSYGEIAYRQAAASGATQIGLLMIVYDALAQDLRMAGSAVRKNDIAGRCQFSNHALLLLGHLESWVEHLGDPALTSTLNQFYGFLRARVLELQASSEDSEFDALADIVLGTRAAWQRKEQLLLEEVYKRNAPQSRADLQGELEPPARSFAWSA